MTNKMTSRAVSLLLCLAMILTYFPVVTFADQVQPLPERASDASTLDGWKDIFKNTSTNKAGMVWTDKTVLTDATLLGNPNITLNDPKSFLVALSAIASNKTVLGQEMAPTDTMFVLDISGSMDGNGESLISALNDSIHTLIQANANNRIGVTVYSSGATLLLPLGSYIERSGKDYFQFSSIYGSERFNVNLELRRSDDTTWRPMSEEGWGGVERPYYITITGGTYIQSGIQSALDQFLAQTSTVVPGSSSGVGDIARKPILVLLSDGAPTYGTNVFDDVGSRQFGNGNTTTNSLLFVTQLTAAYAKAAIENKYNSEALFYTLGVGISDNQEATAVLDPSNTTTTGLDDYWETYQALNPESNIGSQKYMSIGSSLYVERSMTEVDRYYADSYFAADASAGTTVGEALQAAFEEITNLIKLQSEFRPTLVSQDEDLSGYVTFVDRVGKYMTVTDVKGVLIGNSFFSGSEIAKNFAPGSNGGTFGTSANPTALGLEFVESIRTRLGIDSYAVTEALLQAAFNAGQLSYTSDTEYSNYIGWLANADGQYLGFYDENTTEIIHTNNAATNPVFTVKSYDYLGYVDDEQGVTESDMMYATIQVRKNIQTGEEIVTFAIPAALLPVRTYTVGLDQSYEYVSLGVSGAEDPIRLVYELGLRSDINSFTIRDIVDADYIADNTNPDGSVSFYTNKWDRTNTTSYGNVNTYSYFNPSRQNELYYYLQDAPIYADDQGTLYTGTTAPDPSGTYYRMFYEYTLDASNNPVRLTIYRQLSEAALATAVKDTTGDGWHIKAGNVHVNLDGFEVVKGTNTTGTLSSSYVPFVDTNNHSVDDEGFNFYVGATHGNNGVFRVNPATGLTITKTIASGSTETLDDFDFVITDTSATNKANGVYDAYHVDAAGVGTTTQVTFTDGVATVSLAADESLSIDGLDAGKVFMIEEVDVLSHIVAVVNVNGAAQSTKQAFVTISDNNLAFVEFVNEDRGVGELTVTKQITRPASLSGEIPSNLEFEFTVTLSGVGTKNATFEVLHDGSNITSITTDADGKFTFTLKDKEVISVRGLPAGTVATVVETTPAAESGFDTITYYDLGVVGDGVVTVVKNEIAGVRVVNDYTPDPLVGPSIVVSVDKIFEGRENNEWLPTDSFTFELQRYDDGTWTKLAEAVATSANKSVTFTDAFINETFSAAGSYNYRVVEVVPASPIKGVQYDHTVHSFTVVVTDNDMDGKLELNAVNTSRPATVTITPPATNVEPWDVSVDINNVYSVDDVTTVSVDINKFVTTTSGSANTSPEGYLFGLYETEDGKTPGALIEAVVINPTNNRGYSRLNLSFNETHKGQTLQYILKEIPHAQARPGITYTEQIYTVTVEVYDDNEGGLTSVVYLTDTKPTDASATATANFTNIYDPADATLNIDFVNKSLTGRPLVAGEFQFAVYSVDESGVETFFTSGTNNADGTITFQQALTYDKVGNYRYVVKEVNSNANGVVVDARVFRFQVNVVDNGNAQLVATYAIMNETGTTVTFENSYSALPTVNEIVVNKSLSGRPLITDEFSFSLIQVADALGTPLLGATPQIKHNDATGKVRFDAITYNTPGTYYYKLTERSGNLGGVKYDSRYFIATVVVKDNLKGALYVESTTYTDALGASVSTPVFNNIYTPTPVFVELSADKTLFGRVLGSGEFHFEIYAADENWNQGSLIQTVSNEANGLISIIDIEVNTTGTNRIIVKEVDAGKTINGVYYDPTVYYVEVNVTDNLVGNLVYDVDYYTRDGSNFIVAPSIIFVNNYEVREPEQLVISGEKVLNGRPINDGEFTFELYENAVEGTPIKTTTNVGAGFSFTLEFDPSVLGDEESVTLKYFIIEKTGNAAGVTYSNDVFEVDVTIVDNKDGTMSASYTTARQTSSGSVSAPIVFINTYDAIDATLQLTAHKHLENSQTRPLKANEFQFELYESNSSFTYTGSPLQTKYSSETGEILFDEITYNAQGTYYYVVKEIKGSIKGITYDEREFGVTVVVVDDTVLGKIVIDSVTYSVAGTAVDAIVFNNVYNLTPSDGVPLIAFKTLTGKTLEAGMFTYELRDINENLISTATNNADGEIVFDPIVFDEAGVFVFIIREVKGNIGGIVYDETNYLAVINVKDNQEGKLIPGVSYFTENEEFLANGIMFENRYVVSGSTDVTLSGVKTLNGRPQVPRGFVFDLYENDTIIASARNDENGRFEIILNYTEADLGQHTYKLVEREGTRGGVTYSTKEYSIVVSIEDNGVGGIKSTVTVDGEAYVPATLNFVNTYKAAPTEISFSGNKTLNGRPINAGEFSFELYESNADFDLVTKLETVSNFADNTFSFTNIEFDEAGIYYYAIKEDATSKLGGITYDSVVYGITVYVNDDLEGNLHASATYTIGSEVANDISFTNIYDAASTTATIEGLKVLENKELVASQFTFELLESDSTWKVDNGSVIETATNDKNGNFSFKTMTFDEVGSYYYIVREVKGSDGGITYDPTIKHVLIVVTDDLKGQLHSSIQVTDENNPTPHALTFVNSYAIDGDATVTLSGVKTLNGRPINAGEFSFELRENANDGNIVAIGTNAKDGKYEINLNYTESDIGTHKYVLLETNNKLSGVTYSDKEYAITVVVEDNGVGGIKTTVTVDGEAYVPATLNFVNTYKAASTEISFSGNKTLNGRPINAGEFSFDLFEADASFKAGTKLETVNNSVNGAFGFKALKFDTAGTYYYVISEDASAKLGGVTYDMTVYGVKVEVTDDLDGQLHATATYSVVDGNAADGVNFTNIYTPASTTVTIEGLKTLENKDLKAGQFSFELYSSTFDWKLDLGSYIETVTNDENGVFTFTTLTFDKAGTYNFLVKETKGDAGGIDYDPSTKHILVTVTDDLKGQLHATTTIMTADNVVQPSLSFVNVYSINDDKSITIEGEKKINGRPINDGEFVFELYADSVDGTKLQSVNNDIDGAFNFVLNFTEADLGKHVYKIVEKNNGLGGVTYSDAVYTVVVEVTDNGEGGINIEYTITKGAEEVEKVEFVNEYTTENAIYTIEGLKKLIGKELLEDEFTFNLYEADENFKHGDTPIATTTNKQDGKFSFAPLEFEEEGTFFYVVTEDATAQAGGISYDKATYGVKLTVSDDGEGQLVVSDNYILIGGDFGGLVFNNTYKASDAEVTIGGNKTLIGQTLRDNHFSFELYASDADWNLGNLLETVENLADGTFNFQTLKYNAEGVNHYIVKEKNTALGGITYDENVFFITVTVTDNLAGKLIADVEILDGDQVVEKIEFVNTYAIVNTAIERFTGKKILNGRDLALGEFKFILYNSNSTFTEKQMLLEMTNGADGTFETVDIEFNEADVYHFIIVEDSTAAAEGMEYDVSEYYITVTVTDDGAGTLNSEVDVRKNGGEASEIVFVNQYTEPTPPPPTGDYRTLWNILLLLISGTTAAALLKKKRASY